MTTYILDTNIIVRIATREPDHQAQRAFHLLEEAEAGNCKLIATPLILVESMWVLKSRYQASMKKCLQTIREILIGDVIEMEEKEIFVTALDLAISNNVDIIDAWLAVQTSARRDIDQVVTFDKDFKILLLPSQVNRL